jgi:two-component system LytT family sensor kinase
LEQSPLSVKKFLRTFTAWWIVWTVLHALLLYWLGLSIRISITDSLVNSILISAACLLLCYLMQFYLPQKERHWYILIISIMLSTLVAFISRAILRSIYSDEADYLSLLKISFPVRWSIFFLVIVCMSMICVLWYSFLDREETEKRKSAAETMSRDAELFALRRQLQPHFLFNSLNSISALAGTRPEEARKMIQQLSDFLRGTIKKEDSSTVTLAEELQHLQLYLAIEQVRFGHRLNVEIDTNEANGKIEIPSLILQPVVENAIKFGLYDTTDTVTIKLRAYEEAGQLIIKVENPFDPETSMPQKGEGFGLGSVQRRLYLLFGRSDLVSIRSQDKIFTTTIKIPQQL